MRFHISGIKSFESQYIFYLLFIYFIFTQANSLYFFLEDLNTGDMVKPLKVLRKQHIVLGFLEDLSFFCFFSRALCRRPKAFKIRNEETTMRVIQDTRGWPFQYSSCEKLLRQLLVATLRFSAEQFLPK